jgi:hypothetical protein
MRLVPLKILSGTREMDALKAIHSLFLSSTTSTLIIPCHSKLQCNYILTCQLTDPGDIPGEMNNKAFSVYASHWHRDT